MSSTKDVWKHSTFQLILVSKKSTIFPSSRFQKASPSPKMLDAMFDDVKRMDKRQFLYQVHNSTSPGAHRALPCVRAVLDALQLFDMASRARPVQRSDAGSGPLRRLVGRRRGSRRRNIHLRPSHWDRRVVCRRRPLLPAQRVRVELLPGRARGAAARLHGAHLEQPVGP